MEYSISEIISIIGLVSAGIWFYWTQKFRPRVEFDIDCEFFSSSESCEDLVAEIRLTFNNKGFVQHTLKKLELSVHGLSDLQVIKTKDKTHDVIFKEPLFERQTIIPTDWYYWVRPGVSQTITKLIKINKSQSIIRVTSGFTYSDFTNSKHTARRTFSVSTEAKNA